jgi:DNA repair protein NreA
MHLPKSSLKTHPLFNCGKFNCPICAKAYSQIRIKKKLIGENFSTDAVAPFVGRFNYPNLNIGLLTPPETSGDSWLYDAPKFWSYKDFQIPQIVDFRSSLINSRENLNIKKRTKFLQLSQEVSMASDPVDTEINLKQKPRFRVNYDNFMAPTGPYAELKKAKLTANPKIHTKVQKVHYDTGLKANEALIYLYKNKFDENFLSRVLSVGTLGIGKNRKLVPTRYSITATDSNLGNYLVSKIKKYNQCNYLAFFGGYLGNFYLILLFPEVWNYELFETHVSNVNHFMADYEPYEGRKYYADQTAGGFYACRIGILERLEEIKRQGSVLALRFITGDYTLPLGVFVCREATRKALQNKPIEFSSKELMLEYAKKLVKRKFNLNINILLKNSILLKNIKTQTKLVKYI